MLVLEAPIGRLRPLAAKGAKACGRRNLLIGTTVALLAGIFPICAAQACRTNPPPVRLTGTLLPDAEKSPAIVKLRILEVERQSQPIIMGGYEFLPFTATALVLEAVKGVPSTAVITIDASPTVCGGGLYEDQVGREGFVAGRFADGVLIPNRWHMCPRPIWHDDSCERQR